MTSPLPPADDPPAASRRLLTVDELAALKGVPKSFLYKLKADGLIPFVQRCPSEKLRFPADALDRATSRSAPPGAAAPAQAAPASTDGPPKRLSGRRPKWQGGA